MKHIKHVYCEAENKTEHKVGKLKLVNTIGWIKFYEAKCELCGKVVRTKILK